MRARQVQLQKPKVVISEWRAVLLLCATTILGFLCARQLSPYHGTVVSTLRGAAGNNMTYAEAYTQVSVTGLQCVRVMQSSDKFDDFSDFIRSNQAAFFLASYFNTKLSLPKTVESTIVKPYVRLFDKCGANADAAFSEKCVLKMDQLIYNFCPRADCHCMAAQFAPTLQGLVDRGCSTVGVLNDGYKRLEFSGCLSVLKRYLGTTGSPPTWEYDVMQYRNSDFKDYSSEGRPKTPGLPPWLLLKQLCMYSTRDIVVITDKEMAVPRCEDRVVLATGSELQAMQIAQHAHYVSVGISAFAHVLMEFAEPKWVTMDLKNAQRFEYVNCQNWTLVDTRDGSTFHYASKALFVDVMTSTREMKAETKFRKPEKLASEEFEMEVPRRRWRPGMMNPAVVRTL